MKLKTEEIKDIAISSAALTFIFSYPYFLQDPLVLAVYAVAIVTGFVFHELAHRAAANKFGAYAAFRLWPQGLYLAIILAVITNGNFIFAAPGAVVISNLRFGRFGVSPLGRREMGIISAAGPVTNVLLAAIFAALHAFSGFDLFLYAASVNITLALFNMIPIPPLDGSKILNWDLKVWSATAAIILMFRVFVV
ncbi:MAG: site-2 protease family protein [Candidatus Aenigmatarchaeota archaeon]